MNKKQAAVTTTEAQAGTVANLHPHQTAALDALSKAPATNIVILDGAHQVKKGKVKSVKPVKASKVAKKLRMTSNGYFAYRETVVALKADQTKVGVIKAYADFPKVEVRLLDGGTIITVDPQDLVHMHHITPFKAGDTAVWFESKGRLETVNIASITGEADEDSADDFIKSPVEWQVDLIDSNGILRRWNKLSSLAISARSEAGVAHMKLAPTPMKQQRKDWAAKGIRKGRRVADVTEPKRLLGTLVRVEDVKGTLVAFVKSGSSLVSRHFAVNITKYQSEKKELKMASKTHAKAAEKGAGKAPKAVKTAVDTKNAVQFPTAKERAALLSQRDLKGDALKRITKPGVIVIAAVHGLMRVKAYSAPQVEGVTSLHKTVTVHQDSLVPATKKQVDQYREQFKATAKALPTPIIAGTAVALKETPKKKLGYVSAIIKLGDLNPNYEILLADGSDEGVTLAHSEIVAFAGKEPRFEDIPLFGAFIHKSRTLVKVSKSNAIQCQVNGPAGEPFAMLATQASKLGGQAAKRFKKDDRVIAYLSGHPAFDAQANK